MNISTGTITRTIILALALINQILTVTGVSPIPLENETITELISTGALVIASLVTWWKNNSFTRNAIRADKTFK